MVIWLYGYMAIWLYVIPNGSVAYFSAEIKLTSVSTKNKFN